MRKWGLPRVMSFGRRKKDRRQAEVYVHLEVRLYGRERRRLQLHDLLDQGRHVCATNAGKSTAAVCAVIPMVTPWIRLCAEVSAWESENSRPCVQLQSPKNFFLKE
jgi:hypothetical protein